MNINIKIEVNKENSNIRTQLNFCDVFKVEKEIVEKAIRMKCYLESIQSDLGTNQRYKWLKLKTATYSI